MKADIQDNILFGGGARLAGYIRNDSTGNMVRTAVAELKDGSQLLIFPEGTRTTEKTGEQIQKRFRADRTQVGRAGANGIHRIQHAVSRQRLALLKKPQFPLIYKVTLGKRFEITGRHKIICRRTGKILQRATCRKKVISPRPNTCRLEPHAIPITPRTHSVL